MNMNRRQFLGAIIAGTGALLWDQAVFAAKPIVSTDPFQMMPLGKTGIQVSLIGAGTGFKGGNRQSRMTRMGKDKFEALLKYQFERGVRYFDCADTYGTHPFVASAFKSLPRADYVLCSKLWFYQGNLPESERPDANIVVDRFRKELDTDYIDLLLIHCVMTPDWPELFKRQMDIMADLKSKGIIRAHGVSVHSLEALEVCVDTPWVDSVHVRLNAFGEAMDSRDPATVAKVVNKLYDKGKGVVAMKLIGNGQFRDDPEKINTSIEFVLGLGTVNTVIVGFENPEQVDDYALRVQKFLTTRAKNARNHGR